jgi:hypothetical protein
MPQRLVIKLVSAMERGGGEAKRDSLNTFSFHKMPSNIKGEAKCEHLPYSPPISIAVKNTSPAPNAAVPLMLPSVNPLINNVSPEIVTYKFASAY